jgi:hypothetical protein
MYFTIDENEEITQPCANPKLICKFPQHYSELNNKYGKD